MTPSAKTYLGEAPMIEVYLESTLKASLWHGGRRLKDVVGYSSGYGEAYMVRNCLREVLGLAKRHAIGPASSLSIRFEHEVDEVHALRGSSTSTFAARRAAVADLFSPMPPTRLVDVPFETRLAMEDEPSPLPVGDIPGALCAVEDFPVDASWDGYGHEGLHSVHGAVTGKTVVFHGRILLRIPDAGAKPDALHGLWVRPILSSRPLRDARLRYVLDRYTIFDFDRAEPAESKWLGLDAYLRESIGGDDA